VANRVLRLLALALVIAVLYQGALWGSEVLVGRDLFRQFVPRGEAIGQAIARGEVPRWNPWCGHGAPWFGPRAGGVLYPGHLLYAALPIGPAIAWFILLHQLLGIAGMWRLARHDRGGAPWAAAIAWGLGCFLSSLYWALPYLVSAAWTPWALLGATRAAKGDPSGAALLAASLGLMQLAGEPQGVFIAGTLCGFLALRAAPTWRDAPRALALVIVGGLVGAAAGGPALTSIIDEYPRIDRMTSGWKEMRFPLQGAGQLLDALVPDVHAHSQQHTKGFWGTHTFWGGDMPWCQLGVGALGLAALIAAAPRALAPFTNPARARRGEPTDPAGGVALEALAWVAAGLLLAAIDSTWVDADGNYKGLGPRLGLRYPSKWLVISALGLARLVGLGVAALGRDLPGRGLTPYAGQGALVGLVVAGLGLGTIVQLGGPEGFFARVGLFERLDALRGLEPEKRHADVEAWLVSHASGYARGPESRTHTAAALLRAGACALATLVVLRLRASGTLDARQFHALACGVLALDLVTAMRPGMLAAKAETGALDEPPLVAALEDAAGPPVGAPIRAEVKNVFWRYQHPWLEFPEREVDTAACLRTNVGYRFRVRTVLAFESVEPGPLYKIQADAKYHALPLLAQGALLDARVMLVDSRDRPKLGALIGDGPGEARQLGPPVGEYGLLAVLNPLCPPWAYLAGGTDFAADLERARSLVFEHRTEVREVAVIGPEGAPEEPAASPLAQEPWREIAAPVKVVRFAAETVELEADADGPCWLVVRDAFDENWRATVDGAPAPIARADLLYRAVRLEAGHHAIRFEYRPGWWPLGLALLAASLAAMAGLVWARRDIARDSAASRSAIAGGV
jgi:hypothetical protein